MGVRHFMEKILTLASVSTTGAPGTPYVIDLGAVLPKTRNGRPTHLKRLIFDITVQYDVVMATLAAAVPGWRLWGAVRNIDLFIGSHRYVQALHGDEVNHIVRRLLGAYMTAEPTDVADTDASNATRAARFYLPVCHPLPAPGAEYDFALPIAAHPTLKFDIAGTSDVGPAGFTIDGITGEVWAEYVTLDQVNQPPPWAMRRVGPKADNDISFPTEGFLRVCDIRDRISTSESDVAHDDYDAITIRVGKDSLPVMDSDELVILSNAIGQAYPDYAEDSEATPEFIPMVVNEPRTLMTKWPGPDAEVNVKIGTRSDHTNTTFLILETGRFTDAYTQKFREALEIQNEKVVEESRPARKAGGTPAALDPYIPRALYARKLEAKAGSIAGAKAKQKYAGKL